MFANFGLQLAKASTLALVSMTIIVLTVLIQGVMVPSELRGKLDANHLFINDGIFQAVGVISFGAHTPCYPLLSHSRTSLGTGR